MNEEKNLYDSSIRLIIIKYNQTHRERKWKKFNKTEKKLPTKKKYEWEFTRAKNPNEIYKYIYFKSESMCFFFFCRTRINRASYVFKMETNDMHKFIKCIASHTKKIWWILFLTWAKKQSDLIGDSAYISLEWGCYGYIPWMNAGTEGAGD